MHSVKYEDPQALGGLASALDVRQQNAGGVSTMKHVVGPVCPQASVTPRMSWPVILFVLQ